MSRIITQSEFAQATLELKGKPFGFALHAPFKDIYDWPKRRILLKTARQVGKSTFLAGFALTHSARNRHHRVFYASTSEKQAREFARVKLNEFLSRSPRMKAILLNSEAGEINDSVFEKQFSNGSGVTVSYMKDDADRTRGYSADVLMLDEVQDMDHTQLPIVEEILSASMSPMRFYTGTPKTLDNHIEDKWNQSSKHEVFFRCKSCNKFNSIGYKNIGKKGPICTHCGGYLDITRHIWIPTYDKTGPEPYYLGARIPQPALMLHSGFETKWEDLLHKYKKYEEGRFVNEVLGISYSTGKRFLTKDDIIERCTGEPTVNLLTDRMLRMFDLFVMGIDWTGDGVSEVSKNAVVVYGRRAGDPNFRAQVVYKRIFPRQDFVRTMEQIIIIANSFKVRLIGADAGEGALNNAYLADRLGANRVQPFRYGGFDLPARLSVDKRTVYLDKTQAVDDFFMNMKVKGQFVLPPYETFTEEAAHMLAEYEVTGKSGKKIWTHSPSVPDDFLHAMIFGYNAFKMAMGSLKFY